MEANERAEGQAAAGMPERRAHRRYPVDESATLLLLSHGSCIAGRIIDLSEDGCRLRTPAHFSGGVKTRIEISFRIHGISFRFGGVVEWTNAGNFVGVRFVDVPSRNRVELCDVLLEAEADMAAKEAAKPVRAALPNQSRPREDATPGQAQAEQRRPFQPFAPVPRSESSLPSLAAQPQISSRQPEPEVLPMQPSKPPPSRQGSQQAARHTGRDRRAQSRLPIDTSADILLINIGSRVRGRIQDLSVGGCRIHTDERFPVGIYTRVETEFRLQGLPFRLSGVIQAVHDQQRQLVGIRFLDISARKRDQVEQLIKEIEEEHKHQSES
jgi:c-di-GMP-binding flagellar brake protein YcgR